MDLVILPGDTMCDPPSPLSGAYQKRTAAKTGLNQIKDVFSCLGSSPTITLNIIELVVDQHNNGLIRVCIKSVWLTRPAALKIYNLAMENYKFRK